MAIRVTPRAAVEPEFVEVYRRLAELRLRAIHNKITHSYSPEAARGIAKKYAVTIKALSPIVKGKSGAGVGIDLEIARLRALDFERFWVERHPTGGEYLAGLTRDVIMRAGFSKWNVGPYKIYVPFSGIANRAATGIQMVPENMPPGNTSRHPHHTGVSKYEDPLGHSPSTCWSGFGAPMLQLLDDVAVVDIFRLLYTFLSRYNADSPLRRPGSMPHAESCR